MPATSIAQQRLMGQAYALKTGELKPEDLNPKYRKQIEDLADSMSEKDLKDYAETSHEDLPQKVKESNMKSVPTFESFVNEINRSLKIKPIPTTGALTTWFPEYIEILKDVYIGMDSNWTSEGKNKENLILEAGQKIKLFKDGSNNIKKSASYECTVSYEKGKTEEDILDFHLSELVDLYGQNSINILTRFNHDISFFEMIKKKSIRRNESFQKNEFKNEDDVIEEAESAATPASVNGMGAPALPGNPGTQSGFVSQKTGSGDIPYSLVKGQPKKKKKSSFKKFNDFIKGSEEVRTAF